MSFELVKGSIHIVDFNIDECITSDTIFSLDADIEDYFRKVHKTNIKSQSIKKSVFNDDSLVKSNFEKYLEGVLDIVSLSADLSVALFEILRDIGFNKSFDFALFECLVMGKRYLMGCSLGYKESWIHSIDFEREEKQIDLMSYKTNLQSPTSKSKFVFIIDLETLDIQIVEDHDYVTQVLDCKKVIDNDRKIKEVEKAIRKAAKKDEDTNEVELLNEFRENLASQAIKSEIVDVQDALSNVLEDEMCEVVNEELSSKEIEVDKVQLNETLRKKILKKRKFITDSGIEILVPVDIADDKNVIEYKLNRDGTLSIEIKNTHLI